MKASAVQNSYTLGQTLSASWFSFPQPHPKAKLRLFCLPYAGSGANIFYKWPANLPTSVELVLVNAPGREHRLREKPFVRLQSLVESLGRALLPYADKPMAFWGHSLGGLISFELSRYLRRAFGLQPMQLFISACGAPHVTPKLPRLHDLPDEEFVSKLRQVVGANTSMFNNIEFLKLLLPTLKADCAICETYSYTSEPPLDCAITVYGGIDDCNVKYEYLEAWQEETTGRFAMHLFRGAHFFIHSDEALVLKALSEDLNELESKIGIPPQNFFY
jgi:medium-chain acyl-[acyl-carrier-protein] hydrolase